MLLARSQAECFRLNQQRCHGGSPAIGLSYIVDQCLNCELLIWRKIYLNSSAFHLPYDSALVEPAKALRQRPTAAESKLWHEFLNRFPYRVLRQRPIHHFIVDFYCARLKLVIEVDGAVHFTADAEAHDAERTQILAGYGLRVIRFTNQQVMEDFEAVCRRIEGEIPLAPLKRGNRRREEENGSGREDKGGK